MESKLGKNESGVHWHLSFFDGYQNKSLFVMALVLMVFMGVFF